MLSPISGPSTLNEDQIAERGDRMARRNDREYRQYLREEQRSQPGCPAREVVLDQRGRATSIGLHRSPGVCHSAGRSVVLPGMKAIEVGPAEQVGRGGRGTRALAAIVLAHLAISVVHGAAHTGARVELGAAGTAFVYIVILAGPLVGLAIVMAGSSADLSGARPRLGAAIVAMSMAGALVFGLVNHFFIQGADHVAHVAREWRTLFASTAALLAVLEAAGTVIGVRGAVRVRRAS